MWQADDDCLPDVKKLHKQAEVLTKKLGNDLSPPQKFDLRLRRSEMKFLKKVPTRAGLANPALVGLSDEGNDHSVAMGLLIEQICPDHDFSDPAVQGSSDFEIRALRDAIFIL